ncbi:TPA: excinuclease ABC subunit C [Candidatus Peribacteria bacterium]|nr:excinuclease ABC subunit C [Candidatus Peribacteria bacterium]
MFHVYLLRSCIHPQMTYIGFTTKDVSKRIAEHNRKLTKTTAPHIPWKVEVVVSFADRKRAEDFEYYLKAGSGYVFAKRHFWSENPGPTKLAK